MVLAEAGIGKVNTAAVATLLAARFHARILVFSGVAGGLDPALAIGDVVIATRAIQHDCGVIEDERLQPYQAGHVPFFNPTDELGYAVDPDAAGARPGPPRGPRAAAALGARRRRGPAAAGWSTARSWPATSSSTARRRASACTASSQAQAVAMEGGALAQVAERLGVPWLEIRALSDLAGKDSRFDFAAFVHEVAAASAQDPAPPAAGALMTRIAGAILIGPGARASARGAEAAIDSSAPAAKGRRGVAGGIPRLRLSEAQTISRVSPIRITQASSSA